MSTIGAVGFWFLALLGIVGVVLMPRLWREDPPGIEPQAGGPIRRGFIRGIAIAPVKALLLVLAALPFVLDWIPSGSPIARLYGIFGLLVIAVAILMDVGIVLFNRPKFLVPPRFRDQPGAITEWRGARQ